MIKVGIDMDCLLGNMCFSRQVLNMDDVEIHLTTENTDQLDERLSMLFSYYPELKKLNTFIRKEECQFHINHVNIPADWFDYRVEIVSLLN